MPVLVGSAEGFQGDVPGAVGGHVGPFEWESEDTRFEIDEDPSGENALRARGGKRY